MTIFEEAKTLYGMISMKKMTQAEVAEMIGTSQSYVANKLRLLKLPEAAQRRICELGLSERHARALLRIKDEKKLLETVEKIADMQLTVAASEALIDVMCDEELPKLLEHETPSSGIERFEKILKDSLLNLKALGLDVDYRTSYFGTTRYITIALQKA